MPAPAAAPRRGPFIAFEGIDGSGKSSTMERVAAALDAGQAVLCDRYVHSTYAYQSVTLAGRIADPRAFLRRLHEPWCPMPDHVLLFRADPARCLERVKRRGQTTQYERIEFLAKV